jgi:hypothetical protein
VDQALPLQLITVDAFISTAVGGSVQLCILHGHTGHTGYTGRNLIVLPSLLKVATERFKLCSPGAFKRAVRLLEANYHNYITEFSLPSVVTELKCAGLLAPNLSSVRLCSVAFMVRLLRHLRTECFVVDKLRASIESAWPAVMPGQEALQLLLQPHQTAHEPQHQPQQAAASAEAAAEQAAFQQLAGQALANHLTSSSNMHFTIFPNELPAVPPEWKHKLKLGDFGLSRQGIHPTGQHIIKHQLDQMERFYTSPVNMARPEIYSKACSQSSMKDLTKHCQLYLGYCHRFLGVPVQHLTMLDFASPSRMAGFLAIQCQHKHISRNSTHNMFKDLLKVHAFLQAQSAAVNSNSSSSSTAAAAAAAAEHWHKLGQWMTTARQQLKQLAPRPAPPSMSNMPTLQQLFQSLVDFSNKAEREFCKAARDGSLTEQAAAALATAVTLTFMVTCCPPTRLATMRATLHPKYGNQATCQLRSQGLGSCVQGCKGNRLSMLADGTQVMCWPHHKNALIHSSSSRQQAVTEAIQFVVPKQVASLMELWVRAGHPYLTETCFGHNSEPHLFINPATGKGFTETQLSPWFKQCLKQLGIPEPLSFCPRLLRHLFVTTCQELLPAGAPVPHLPGLQQLMGHTQRQWQTGPYNLLKAKGGRHKLTHMQLAVDGMADFRQFLLEHSPNQLQQSAAAAAAPAMQPVASHSLLHSPNQLQATPAAAAAMQQHNHSLLLSTAAGRQQQAAGQQLQQGTPAAAAAMQQHNHSLLPSTRPASAAGPAMSSTAPPRAVAPACRAAAAASQCMSDANCTISSMRHARLQANRALTAAAAAATQGPSLTPTIWEQADVAQCDSSW